MDFTRLEKLEGMQGQHPYHPLWILSGAGPLAQGNIIHLCCLLYYNPAMPSKRGGGQRARLVSTPGGMNVAA